MSVYWCHLLDAELRIAKAQRVECADDDGAKRAAHAMLATTDDLKIVEVWNAARRIYVYPGGELAPEQTTEQATATTQAPGSRRHLHDRLWRARQRRRRRQDLDEALGCPNAPRRDHRQLENHATIGRHIPFHRQPRGTRRNAVTKSGLCLLSNRQAAEPL
jgi:hypothetical protein